MRSNTNIKNSLRYRLHSRVRKQGYNLVTKDRTIYQPHEKGLPDSKYITRLVNEFGYAVQLTI
ncbi:MAG: hypothetical protein Q7J05_04255 [Paludibacter sp.]|nr:hypothetical protein [Paludibacter sp.]